MTHAVQTLLLVCPTTPKEPILSDACSRETTRVCQTGFIAPFCLEQDLCGRVRLGLYVDATKSTGPPKLTDDDLVSGQTFDDALKVATEGRVLFELADASLGLGPSSMATGDEIHRFPGGNTHFVLRQIAPAVAKINAPLYSIVGDCHLQPISKERELAEAHGSGDETAWEGGLPEALLYSPHALAANSLVGTHSKTKSISVLILQPPYCKQMQS